MQQLSTQETAQAKFHLQDKRPLWQDEVVQEAILYLYEIAIEQLKAAKRAIRSGDLASKGTYVGQAITTIGKLEELLSTDPDNQVASFLRGLYLEMICKLPRATCFDDVQVVNISIRYLSNLRYLWKREISLLKEKRVSGNAYA